MKKYLTIGALALAFAAILASCGSPVFTDAAIAAADEGVRTATVSAAPAADAAEGRYIVAFKEKPTAAARSAIAARGARIEREFKIVNAMSVRVADKAALAAIEADPNVAYVEPDYIRYALGETVPWGVIAVKAPQAWPTSTGDAVKVAVIDTGIDYGHPELAANYKGGYDFVNKDSDPFDDNGHGTHCSGTIGAVTNNDLGVASVAYNVDLYALKVLSAEGSGYSTDILAAVDWAVQNGMDIASMSLGGGSYSTTENTAYTNAVNAGLFVICATGNDGATTISYPAGYAATFAVGAVDSALVKADFSNSGTGIDVVAPGVNVLSTVPRGTGTVANVTYGTSTLAADAMEFSPAGTVTGKAIYCGIGDSAAAFPSTVAGNIALIQRGTISFVDKVNNAMAAGAKGVIIYNNVAGTFTGTLGTAGTYVPTVSMSMEDGEYLKSLNGPTVTLYIGPWDYAYFDGTSMATPHVSAVAALVKGANPALTVTQMKDILRSTATDLGASGYDTLYGYGIVNAEAAVYAAVNPPDPADPVTEVFTGTLAKRKSVTRTFAVAGGVFQAALSWSPSTVPLTMKLYNPSGLLVAQGTTSLSYDTGSGGSYKLTITNGSRTLSATYTLTATYLK